MSVYNTNGRAGEARQTLDSIEWDSSLHCALIDLNGTTVPFRSVSDAGDDVVFWKNHRQTKLAARAEDVKFNADEVEERVEEEFEAE